MVIVNLLVTEGITQFERSFLGTITSFRDKQNSMFVDCFRYDSYPPKKELVPMEKVRLGKLILPSDATLPSFPP